MPGVEHVRAVAVDVDPDVRVLRGVATEGREALVPTLRCTDVVGAVCCSSRHGVPVLPTRPRERTEGLAVGNQVAEPPPAGGLCVPVPVLADVVGDEAPAHREVHGVDGLPDEDELRRPVVVHSHRCASGVRRSATTDGRVVLGADGCRLLGDDCPLRALSDDGSVPVDRLRPRGDVVDGVRGVALGVNGDHCAVHVVVRSVDECLSGTDDDLVARGRRRSGRHG